MCKNAKNSVEICDKKNDQVKDTGQNYEDKNRNFIFTRLFSSLVSLGSSYLIRIALESGIKSDQLFLRSFAGRTYVSPSHLVQNLVLYLYIVYCRA